MQMDEGLDTGDVLASVIVPIDTAETAGTLFDKLELAGIPCLLDTLGAIEASTISPSSQPDEGVTYAKKISKDEAQVNWNQPADAVNRTIRAFNPEPIAYSFLGDLRIKIWTAEPVGLSGHISGKQPGTIVELTKRGLTVACETGDLLITGIQLPLGKGTMLTGKAIMNSRKDVLVPGSRFHAQ